MKQYCLWGKKKKGKEESYNFKHSAQGSINLIRISKGKIGDIREKMSPTLEEKCKIRKIMNKLK